MTTEPEILNPVVVQQKSAISPPQMATPDALLVYAMEKGADLDRLEKLMELKARYEADQARKAFVVDMAEFKKHPPQIIKEKLVGFVNRDGGVTGYRHATLGSVTQAIVDGLAQHGFSHRWDTKVDGASIIVTCILTHRLGHSESTTLSSGRDDSGKKNAIQAMASAITYLQRYTLLAATGLATHDQHDDDGRSAAGSDERADTLIADAFRAKDLKTLQDLWERGSPYMREFPDDFVAFKAAVNAAKAALQPPPIPKAGTSSRLASIVGAQADATTSAPQQGATP